jgi:hypothetical protein
MLPRLALLLFLLPAVALAQAARPVRAVSAPSSAKAATATPATASQPDQTRLAAAAPPADPAQCRIACAQTNYLCRAGERADDCGGGWSQCVAACDLPDMIPDVSTAP